MKLTITRQPHTLDTGCAVCIPTACLGRLALPPLVER